MNPNEREVKHRLETYEYRIFNFIHYIEELVNKKLSSTEVIKLQLRIEKIESVFKQFEEAHLQYVNCNNTSQFARKESMFYEALSKSKYLLLKHNNHTVSMSSTDNSTQTTNPSPLQCPKNQLPIFNGSYSQWLHFRETFTRLIHSNDLIDDIEKFRYLRDSVEDSAAELIQSVDFSASNYAVAWKLIYEKYNNKNMLVQCHLSSLFNIEAIKEASSIALKGVSDQLHKNLQELELLGEPVKKWDSLLLHIFTPKLDEITRREWDEYRKGEEDNTMMTFDAFLQFLHTRAVMKALEMKMTKNEISE